MRSDFSLSILDCLMLQYEGPLKTEARANGSILRAASGRARITMTEIYRSTASLTNYCGPFQRFQSFNRYATFIMGIGPFQTFKTFNRFAPFKTLTE
jgi:hypothetical protein